ncbi:bifunctional fucokinase/fucose-1-phosphate guanylyltransferase [Phocaeicola paurosaccharolyticus]|uniref:bifunctional fucokinase/fucose-1-phosphate guanylyltransferase n=1 Tax=Phocaeicola paurosaccharolyticus TaxID=732242 RepID=UPI002FDFFAA6
MKRLLSLPPNLVKYFSEIERVNPDEWFCTSDPINSKLGSGGGTTFLLEECFEHERSGITIDEWLGKEKRILLHAGGQSRRLPGYAPSGKILTPIPVFRWAKGQRLDQNLLQLQLPLYNKIMKKAPESLHTLIASGDVYIRTDKPLQNIPSADVVCYGLWADPMLAKNHGVFVSSREKPDELVYMLQKPSVETLAELMKSHLFLMDIGIWLLSDKAVSLLMKRSKKNGAISYYDMYSEFGLALGNRPKIEDDELSSLSVAILPLDGGEFYHFGTSRELISSTLAIQNIVRDQREIMHYKVKPHPAMFVQNSIVNRALTCDNSEIWIENSYIAQKWRLNKQNIITGVPVNDWNIEIPSGVCVDIVPIGEDEYAVRPYGFNDPFRGPLAYDNTIFLGDSVTEWLSARGISPNEINGNEDIQSSEIFAVVKSVDDIEKVLKWMISEPENSEGLNIWMKSKKISADTISSIANIKRLYSQRDSFRKENWESLSANYDSSVFYQLDLKDAARNFARNNIDLPKALPESASLMRKIGDSMFRAEVERRNGRPFEKYEERAFGLMRESLVESALSKKQSPQLSVFCDQIVWGRSPVRIDLAGGWTDTPPYSLYEGGNVVNLAIELNGQPPLQVYVKPSKEYKIILRSIDMGAMEVVTSYKELSEFKKIGSPFSIPKAALVLAGFHNDFSAERYTTLEEQLKAFGSGIEITLLSAIPAGSGLGTSSILASTVLGAVSDFCGLNWDKNEICNRTLVLEQLLTTGGGWQDQYGGVLHGVKLLQTNPGIIQTPMVRWLPESLFTDAEYRSCHILYYTGITRTAKGILAEIVRSMFLNSHEHLSLLAEMKEHALDLYDSIVRGDFVQMGQLIGKTWEQNKLLDSGTNPDSVNMITEKIKDLCHGYKLPGAGGGGYLYMIAKDPEAAVRIKNILSQEQINGSARFVDMSLSPTGLQISRS